MAAISGVNIAMLPEEHEAFWSYLATSGEILACALGDDPTNRQYAPAPPAEFVRRFAERIQRYDSVGIFLGSRESVFNPRIVYFDETVGGEEVLLSEPDAIPRISKKVGGTKVRRPHLDHAGSQLIRYAFGVINNDNVMERTTASFYSTHLVGNNFKRHPDDFLKWGKKVLAWLRRRIAGKVPVYRCNYEIPASALVIEAAKKGLKVV